MNIEIWKDVPGYEGFYKASNLGRVKRLATDFIDKEGKRYRHNERIFSPNPRINKPRCGYAFIELSKNDTSRTFPVHQIIALCFLPPKPFDKAEINHKDFVKTNNYANNLEWCSHADNMRHAFINNPEIRRTAKAFGIRTRELNSKLTKNQVHEIRNLLIDKRDSEIAVIFGVDRKTINHIRHKKSWAWLDSPHPNFPKSF